ncbi:MAG: AAA family ATPase [Ferrimicrobium acidiphilum]
MSTTSDDRQASVLLSFRGENVRSFRGEIRLSMLATAMADKEAVRYVTWRERGQPVGVLPVAGAFGANASGKTNLLRAMDDMRAHVLYSFRSGSPVGGVPRRSFALDGSSTDRPSQFEIDIVLNGVRHQYGFTFDDQRFTEEWAYRFPHGRAALLFRRRGLEVELGALDRVKGKAVTELLRPNALFLSTAASANHPALLPLYGWFSRNLVLAEAKTRPFRQVFTTQMLEDKEKGERVLALLRAADLGVSGAKKQELDPVMRERAQRAVRILMGQEGKEESAEEGPTFDQLGVRLIHEGVAGNVELDADDESLGTLVWFGLIGAVVDALANGTVFLADELDASLHPSLVRQLVRLFQDPVTNPRQAQMIFNAHDATLLGEFGNRELGRDQIWFTEKLHTGSTRIYPLTDLDPRKDEAVGRRYLSGRYGATPILSDQEFSAAAELIMAGNSE